MEPKPKLIILYGFAASGKTTLAKKYTDNHPLSMMIEGDEIINMMGEWRKYESEARNLVFSHTCSIVKNQLQSGHNVLLPYLLTDESQIKNFEEIATAVGCDFYEVSIHADKDTSLKRLLKRGKWGEAGSPDLTENDMPEIESLYTVMDTEMKKRTNVKTFEIIDGDVEGTYRKLMEIVGE